MAPPKFVADEVGRCRFLLRDLPFFVEHDVVLQDGKRYHVGRRWMDLARRKAGQRYRRDGYMAPVHEEHNEDGQPLPAPIGRMMPTKLRQVPFDGKRRWVLFADLYVPSCEAMDRIRRGELAYRSAEVHDLRTPEIDSLALMKSRVPFFRMALLDDVSIRKAVGRRPPVAMPNSPRMPERRAAVGYAACYSAVKGWSARALFRG